MLFRPAPELVVDCLLNSPEPLSLEGRRGHVMLIEGLHTLCPGCVSLGLRQAKRVFERLKGAERAPSAVCRFGRLVTLCRH